MQAIQSLTSDRDEALRKVSRLDVTCDSYQTRLENAERKIDELQKAIVSLPTPYVDFSLTTMCRTVTDLCSCLLMETIHWYATSFVHALMVDDPNERQFLDDYIKDGAAGGERAARDLRQSILDHLKDKSFYQHDYKILVRLYANVHGLSKTYTDARIISNSKVFLDFVQAFNKSHDLVEIVDAGNDKEAADSKIKGLLPSVFLDVLHADTESNIQSVPT